MSDLIRTPAPDHPRLKQINEILYSISCESGFDLQPVLAGGAVVDLLRGDEPRGWDIFCPAPEGGIPGCEDWFAADCALIGVLTAQALEAAKLGPVQVSVNDDRPGIACVAAGDVQVMICRDSLFIESFDSPLNMMTLCRDDDGSALIARPQLCADLLERGILGYFPERCSPVRLSRLKEKFRGFLPLGLADLPWTKSADDIPF